MFNQMPTQDHITKAVISLKQTYQHPTMDFEILTRILCTTTCPPVIVGSITNATCNEYANAGGRFDRAGDPVDYNLFVEKNLAIHNQIIDLYNRKDV